MDGASAHRHRPRFAVRVPLAADAVVARLRERLAQPGCPCRGMVADRHRVVDLRVLPEDRHLWSPSLQLKVEEPNEEAEAPARPAASTPAAVVHGLIGPEPAVWTAVAFVYGGLGTALLFLLIFARVQWSLGQTPWAFWLAGVTLAGLLATWLVALAGKRRAAPQTAALRHFLEDALDLGPAERARTDEDPYRA